MRRVAPAVILCLLFILPGFAQAQTCPSPVVMLVGGSNPACAGQPVTLDAGPGWTTYLWSPGAATTRMITVTPNATMSYSVTTTDANGCEMTSQPLTLVVNTASYTPPLIHDAPADICPGGSGSAWIDTASPAYSTVTWTVQNGTITNGAASHSVSFAADHSGLPVVLTVAVADANGCSAQSDGTIPIRTIPPPAIHTYEANICPTGYGNVYIDGPAAGGGWDTISWTIEHGSLPYGNNSMSASFTADGSGQPVVLHVTVRDYGMCEAQNSITIPIRTIPTPAIHTYEANICPTGYGNVYIDGPAAGGGWSSISWTIEHGSLPYGSESMSASFTADGSGQPVVLHVTVRDYGMCEAQNSITIPIRTIPTPAIHTYEANICPTGYGNVYIDGPAAGGGWSSISWTIEHGSLPYGSESMSSSFTADGSGQPVVLHVTVRDYGMCEAQNSISIPIRTIPAPAIHTYETNICPTGFGNVYIDGPAAGGGWNSISWTIEHGSLPYGNNSMSASFTADGSGQPVVLHVTVRDYGMCAAQNSLTLPVQTVPVVSIQPDQSTICVDGYGAATIDAPAPGNTWSYINWTVDHGTVVYGQGTPRVNFQGDGSGNAVVVHVSAQDGGSCAAQSSVTLPTRTLAPPVIALGTGACPTTASVTNASDYVVFQWSADNAEISGSMYEASVTFHPRQNGHVTLTVVARDASGCEVRASAGYDVTGLPDITTTLSSIPFCYGSPVTASVPDGGQGVTYQWSLNSGRFLGSSTSPTVTFIPEADTLALTVTATNAQGCSASGTGYTLVNRPPVGDFNSVPASVCANGTATISTYANGVSYDWQVIDGDVVSGSGTSAITFRAHNAATVTVRLTKTGQYGCAATYERIIRVTSVAATVTSSGPTTFCAGGSVTLTATTGASYLWSNGATTQAITVNAAGSYSVTVTNANGCSATSAPSVVTVDNPTASITASGPTTFCAGGSVTLSAPAGYASYAWSSGASGPSITVNSSGSYSVTVTTAAGCSATSAATAVTVNPVPAPHIVVAQQYTALTPSSYILAQVSGNTYTYCGTATIGLTATGGGIGAQFHWSTGQQTAHINVTQSGIYTVTITNAEGCSADDTVTININPIPTATITAAGPLDVCPNGGSVVLTANAADSYLWSTGATTRSIVVTQPGDYHVAVTIGGCTATSGDTTVTVRSTGVIAGGRTFCPGGSVTLSAPGGSSYAWNTGATTQSITVSSAGGYSVTVTDATGCSMTPPVATVVGSSLAVSVSASATTICEGQTSTMTASATGGTGNYSYQWFNYAGPIAGATSASYNASAPEEYYVVTTDAGGCSVSTTDHRVVLAVTAAPAGYIYFLQGFFCSGDTKTVIGLPLSGVTYAWTVTNGTLQSASGYTAVITAGTSGNVTIGLTVTNSSGCSWTGTKDFPIVQPPPVPVITASGPTTFCHGDAPTLTAPAGYSYTWRFGSTVVSTEQSLTIGESGSVTVTVTNASGCSTTSQPVVLTANPLPVANITAGGPTTFCAGGSVTLTASSGASYLWSNGGATTQSISASTSGNYSVTVTNANGCSAPSAPTTVTVNANPTASITAGGPTTFCAGSSVTLTASSGSSYLWSTGATTQSISASTSGNYSVTVTNASGCSAPSAPTTVTVNANPTATITAGGPTTFCAGGSVTLTASPGSSYSWSTGATTQSITVNSSGSYTVTVTGANGCSATSAPAVVTVNAAQVPTITANGPTTFCFGTNVVLTASAGVSYLWSNGSTNRSISVNGAGSYSVTVTDANGCTATSAPTTTALYPYVNAQITPSGPTTFCAGGSVTFTASGGVSYLWSTGATTPSIVLTTSGTYFVTVTDAQGCSSSTSYPVTVNPNPQAVVTANGPTTFCAGGSVTLTASSGSSYLWSNGATTQSISAGTSSNYSVTVTNASGCSATSQPTVVTVNSAAATITAGGPTTFCAGGNVTLTASSGSSYLWSTGATTQAINASTSGNYSVTVTNANGCSAPSAPTTVTVNANPAATITAGGPTTFCAGGSVTLTASNGSSYLWSTGATTPSISASTGGNYSVTITSSNGCSTASTPTTVTVNANPAATITAGGPTTFCTGGSVTLTASSGSSYLWSTGATSLSISASTGGNYSVTVTNPNGCSAASAPTTVTVRPRPTASVSGGGAICPGGSATITAALTGTAPWSVTWSDNVTQTINSGTTASRSVSPASATTYTVTSLSDANCTGTSSGSAAVTIKTLPTATVSGGGAICPGSSATITAALTGTAPWSVTWSDNVTQTINSGTTASRSVSPAVTTTYTVTSVSDAASCPRAGTGSAAVTIKAPASITTQPVNQTTTRNTNVTLSVVAAGTAPISYQWFNGSTIISGATSSTYTTSFTKKGTNTFYVEVWNACNATHVRSNTVTITVN